MWPDNDTPEPAAWINFNAATSLRNVSFVCESELASIPLWPEPPRAQRSPLSEDMVHRAMIALNTASDGELQPTFDEMKAALEAAHGIKGEA